MSKEKFKNKGITLIALIITIIVMLILTGVTLSITLGDNGLVNKAKEATTQTQVAMDRELLLSAVVGTINENGEINLAEIVLPAGFTGSNGTYTSKNRNTFTVSANGEIIYTGSDDIIDNDGESEIFDINGKYYGTNNEITIEIANHNKITFVYYYEETITEEWDIDIKYNENNNTGSINIFYEEDYMEEEPFVYVPIKENNQIVNKVLVMNNMRNF